MYKLNINILSLLFKISPFISMETTARIKFVFTFKTNCCNNLIYLHICFLICHTTQSVKQQPFKKITKAEFVFNTLTLSQKSATVT